MANKKRTKYDWSAITFEIQICVEFFIIVDVVIVIIVVVDIFVVMLSSY
jgi:hypothetical protein